MTDRNRLDAMIDIYERVQELRDKSIANDDDGVYPPFGTCVFGSGDDAAAIRPAIQIFASRQKMQEMADDLDAKLIDDSDHTCYFLYRGMAFTSVFLKGEK